MNGTFMITLSAVQTTQFHLDGFLVLRGVVPATICDLMQAITEAHLASTVEPVEFEAEVGYPGAPVSL